MVGNILACSTRMASWTSSSSILIRHRTRVCLTFERGEMHHGNRPSTRPCRVQTGTLCAGTGAFTTAASLVHDLMEARDERRLRMFQKHLDSVKLLILDELGYV